MAATKNILAFDLGAESGRALLGRFDGRRIDLKVVHRFPNGGVQTLGPIYWDVLYLYREMLGALAKTSTEVGGRLDSVGVDTWGVDFALVDRNGHLLGNPRHYRDPHTETIMEETFARVPRREIFEYTGLQFIRFNTLFQLLALQRDRSPSIDAAERLLMMPDLFHYWFTGVQTNEYTDASTSQMIDPRTRNWCRELVERCGLNPRILGPLTAPATEIGVLTEAVRRETGLGPVPVIAPATHDTASAVAAVPAKKDRTWAYISSGTWSLMGIEIAEPVINDDVAKYNFTNEGGIGGTVRFLKNIMGLWLVQASRRAWAKSGQEFSYDELTRLAIEAPAFTAVIDPDHSSFMLPEDMPVAIADFCRKTGQRAPDSPGGIVRCALESLALRYRWVIERLEELHRQRIDVIHIVGGGSQNRLLCQFAADACNRPVFAGPVEATAIGNVLVQAIGLGLIASIDDLREVVRDSFEVVEYTPLEAAKWDEPYARFLSILKTEADV